MTAKLEFFRISKRFGDRLVADDISFEVDPGEFFVILGPSGEGKSTLLRMVAGIETVDAGLIRIDGQDITHLPPHRRNVAMVFQNYALYPNMNVYKNIAFPLKMQYFPAEEIRPKVEEVARTLGITEILDRRVNQISGGQQQRVALARAIVRNPKLFLLDEPLSNLDARVRFSARAELKKIQRDLGQTFVYVTHDQKEAESLSDRTGVLHLGRFEQLGAFHEIYESPVSRWVGDFVGDYPMNYLPDGPEGQEIGFRTEWMDVGEGPFSAVVEVAERQGDLVSVLGRGPDGRRIFLTTLQMPAIGDTIRFGLRKKLRFSADGARLDDHPLAGPPPSPGAS
jgi:trehalose transport system ATP-binding protein